MNFLNFEYILAIQKAGTLRGAAEALYISPQALSDHLGRLEAELGAPLFRRTRPLTLTAAGERFVECAETCLAARQRLETELAAILRRSDSYLSLGIPSGMPPPMLLSFLSYFRHSNPELTVTVSELPTRTGALHEIPGHIDAVFGEFQGDDSRMQFRAVLRSARFVIALRRELLHSVLGEEDAAVAERCVAENTPADLALFRNCPFVLKRSGSVVRQNEDRLFRGADFVPAGSMETGDMEMTIRLVLLGEAAVFLPEPVARANFILPAALEPDNAILLCPVDAGDDRWTLSVGFDRFRRIPRSVAALEEAARTYYENMLGPSAAEY